MECSDSDSGEENSTSPERNRCCGAHAFFERKVSEQLIAISLVELPDSGDSEQENHSEEEGPGSEERKRAAISSGEGKRAAISSEERKRAAISSEERKRETINSEGEKRATISSEEEGGTPIDSDSEEERSWRQLMKEEAEYEKHLERQVAEFEEESKTWGVKPPKTSRVQDLNCKPRDQGYQFHMKPSNLQCWIGESGDITQLTECVEGLLKSHMYTVYTAMQHAHANSVQVPRFILWLDWDLDKLKLHPNTVKMSIPRLDIGPDGQQSQKDRRLWYLRNGDHNLCLSYATQSLRIHGDQFLARYGLKMEEGTFPFTTGVVRYLVLTYDHPKRQWIMDRLVDPVLVMNDDDLDAEGCGPNFEAVATTKPEGCVVTQGDR